MHSDPDFFELYQIPASFHPDQAVVKKKFYELSRLYHPDRFAQAGGDALAHAMHMATLNNKAYKTLTDAGATMAYILKAKGLMTDEEQYKLPPDFLMEMMDLNELVSEYEDAPYDAGLRNQVVAQVQAHLDSWQTQADELTKAYDNGATNDALLLKIKDCYFRKKYLLRIKERIDTFAAR